MSDAARLDDAPALEADDPAGMLRAIASAAAQVREAAVLSAEAGVARLVEDGRPRAVVVCGMGGSGIAGDVLAAAAGPGCPVPVVTHRGHGLPGWVSPVDLVVAVSCSGRTQETLSALEEAVRRGCRLLVVGAEGSPLADLGERGRAVFVPVMQGRQPRASLWSLALPPILAAHELGLLSAPPAVVEATASALEAVAEQCRIDAEAIINPAKRLAIDLDTGVPVLWGTSPLTGTVAYRFACQLNENAQLPAVHGVLPEVAHNQVVSLDGPCAGGSTDAADDFFRDRIDDQEPAAALTIVLLRDAVEHPAVARAAEVSAELARERGLQVVELRAEGDSALERLASMIGTTDYASAYVALLQGTDPTPVAAITALKQRLVAPAR